MLENNVNLHEHRGEEKRRSVIYAEHRPTFWPPHPWLCCLVSYLLTLEKYRHHRAETKQGACVKKTAIGNRIVCQLNRGIFLPPHDRGGMFFGRVYEGLALDGRHGA